MAGAPCPIEVMRRVIDRMNMREITIAYGMTETSPVSFQSATDDPIERRVSTVGEVHPHLEVKIIDPEGMAVQRGEQGELWQALWMGRWLRVVAWASRTWLSADRHRPPHVRGQGSGGDRLVLVARAPSRA